MPRLPGIEGGRDFDEELQDKNNLRMMYNSAITKSKNVPALMQNLDDDNFNCDANDSAPIEGKIPEFPINSS